MKVVECHLKYFRGLNPEIANAARLLGIQGDTTFDLYLQGLVLNNFPDSPTTGLGVYRDGDVFVDALGADLNLSVFGVMRDYCKRVHGVLVEGHSHREMNPDSYLGLRGRGSTGVLFRAPRNR